MSVWGLTNSSLGRVKQNRSQGNRVSYSGPTVSTDGTTDKAAQSLIGQTINHQEKSGSMDSEQQLLVVNQHAM